MVTRIAIENMSLELHGVSIGDLRLADDECASLLELADRSRRLVVTSVNSVFAVDDQRKMGIVTIQNTVHHGE